MPRPDPSPRLHVSSDLFVHWCTAPSPAPDTAHDCPNALGRLRGERTRPDAPALSWRFEPAVPSSAVPLPWGSYTSALRDAYDYAAEHPDRAALAREDVHR